MNQEEMMARDEMVVRVTYLDEVEGRKEVVGDISMGSTLILLYWLTYACQS